ncbi:MAG: hypothetical protein H6716_09665 [Polyangiaceae bacterium]|nr:hypothetical protein [Polyangiaceae bacterium]
MHLPVLRYSSVVLLALTIGCGRTTDGALSDAERPGDAGVKPPDDAELPSDAAVDPRVDLSGAPSLELVASVPLAPANGWRGSPVRIVATAAGFAVVSGSLIPDGLVPVRSGVLSEHGSVTSTELEWRCQSYLGLQGGAEATLLCFDAQTLHVASLGAKGALAGVQSFALDEADTTVSDPTGTTVWVRTWRDTGYFTLRTYDVASGKQTHQETYEHDVSSPALAPGSSGAWLTSGVLVDRAPTVTVHRLPDGASYGTSLCEDTKFDSHDLVEVSTSAVALAEMCGDDVRVSLIDVVAGSRDSIVFRKNTEGWGAPLITHWGEQLAVAAGKEIVVLDPNLQVRAVGSAPDTVYGVAAKGATLAVLSGAGDFSMLVTLFRLPE